MYYLTALFSICSSFHSSTRLYPNTEYFKGSCRFAVFKTGTAAGLYSRLSPSCHKPYQEPANTASQIPGAQIPPGSTKYIQQQKLPQSIIEHRKWHVKTSRNWLATDVNSFILLLSFFNVSAVLALACYDRLRHPRSSLSSPWAQKHKSCPGITASLITCRRDSPATASKTGKGSDW